MKDTSFDIHQGMHAKDYGLIFKAIMQHSKDGLFVTDHRGHVVMINRATEQMCEIKAHQVLGRNVRDLVKEGFWNPAVSLQVIEKKRPISLIQTTRRDKKLLSTGIPICDDQNELKFVLVNDRDISFLNSLIETLEADTPAENLFRFELSDYGLAAAEMEGVVIRQDLETMVAGGKFRSDLFFRLNEVPIQIPALRQRSEDVDPLIQHFLARYNQEFNTNKIISKTVREALCQYRFPGNVRELENLIKRLITRTEGDIIRLKNIPALLRKSISSLTANVSHVWHSACY